MFLSEWCEFPSASCLAGKKNLMTARVSMLLKSSAYLICFLASFVPGRSKDLSGPRLLGCNVLDWFELVQDWYRWEGSHGKCIEN